MNFEEAEIAPNLRKVKAGSDSKNPWAGLLQGTAFATCGSFRGIR